MNISHSSINTHPFRTIRAHNIIYGLVYTEIMCIICDSLIACVYHLYIIMYITLDMVYVYMTSHTNANNIHDNNSSSNKAVYLVCIS